jgi:hypothetical protein
MQIIDYVVLSSEDPGELRTLILDLADKGWWVQGGVSVVPKQLLEDSPQEYLYNQAMVVIAKREDTDARLGGATYVHYGATDEKEGTERVEKPPVASGP